MSSTGPAEDANGFQDLPSGYRGELPPCVEDRTMANAGEHVLNHIDAYCRGELTAAERARIEQHCESCVRCQAALDVARQRAAQAPTPRIKAPGQYHSVTWSTFVKVFVGALVV